MIMLGIMGILVIGLFLTPFRSDGFYIILAGVIVGGVISFIANAAIYYGQVEKIEKIEEAEARGNIFREKAKALTEEFKHWLGDKYPDAEKEIFKNLIPENVAMFAVRFPEIKSSETIEDLVSRINGLQNDVYDEKLNIEEYKREIRVNKRNPWVIRSLIPIK